VPDDTAVEDLARVLGGPLDRAVVAGGEDVPEALDVERGQGNLLERLHGDQVETLSAMAPVGPPQDIAETASEARVGADRGARAMRGVIRTRQG
jgi:hypothetical protein